MVATEVWCCRRCSAPLDMHLDHVGCGAPGASCSGTWRHPRNRCALSGRNVTHADAFLSGDMKPQR